MLLIRDADMFQDTQYEVVGLVLLGTLGHYPCASHAPPIVLLVQVTQTAGTIDPSLALPS